MPRHSLSWHDFTLLFQSIPRRLVYPTKDSSVVAKMDYDFTMHVAFSQDEELCLIFTMVRQEELIHHGFFFLFIQVLCAKAKELRKERHQRSGEKRVSLAPSTDSQIHIYSPLCCSLYPDYFSFHILQYCVSLGTTIVSTSRRFDTRLVDFHFLLDRNHPTIYSTARVAIDLFFSCDIMHE